MTQKVLLLTCDNPKMGHASIPFLAPNNKDLQSERLITTKDSVSL